MYGPNGGMSEPVTDEPVIDGSIIAAAFELIAAKGWHGLSRADVAAHAGVPLSNLYGCFPSKASFVTGLIEQTDKAVLADEDSELAEEVVRDRLFDVLMRRFDGLEDYRPGIRILVRELPADPFSAALIAPVLLRSMGWMLEAAAAGGQGLSGIIKGPALAVIYLEAMRVWLGDEDPGRARTMAALDRGLRRAEQVMDKLVPLCPGGHLRPSNGDVDEGAQTAEGTVS